MKFNFRKITSVLASVVMIGATVGIASAAAYPSPFIKSGAADVAIVIGANAATVDNIAAVDIASNLQAELAKQTATTGTSGTSATEESINLATGSQKLYLNSKMSDARTSLTKSELPVLLADNKVIDDAGTEYSYTQSLTLGSRAVNYSTSGGDLDDPELLIEVGTTAASYLYQYILTFNKNLNMTHTDVQGNTITILGKDYTIGSGSTSVGTDKLVLFGAGTDKTLKEGETASIEIGGATYSVQVTSIEQISSVNYVSISVDGSTIRRIAEGSSSKSGGLEIYAKTVHYLAKEAQVSYADLSLGTTKLTLQLGSSAKEGSDETSIYGTEVDIDASSSGDLSALKVNVSMTKSTKDYIKAGESFTDPVFGGIKTQFVSVTPVLDATTRESIKIDTDNSRNAKVTFTSALAGDAGEKTIYFAHDSNDADTAIAMFLTDSANKTIHVVEGENISINQYAVINAGDYGRIVKLTEVPTGNFETTSKIQFEDIITGKTLFEGSGLTVGSDGNASTNIDGNSYYFAAYNNTAGSEVVKITWGASAVEGGVGSATTVFPRIKLAKGGWLAFMSPVSLVGTGKTYALPGVQTLATYEAGAILANVSEGVLSRGNKSFGNLNFAYKSLAQANNNITMEGIDVDKSGTLVPGTDCLFNDTIHNGAAILFIEEKKSTESGNSDNGDAICVNLDESGTTTIEASVATPVVTGVTSPLTSLTSDSNKRHQVTRYGTYIDYDSTDNDAVTIKYPDEQMIADVVIASVGAEVTTTATGGTVAELGSVAVMDSEIDTVSSKNLVVVGGSCINTVAAKLLDSTTPICGADFTNKTGISADQFLIKAVDSPYATGKIAMLVAGYEGADTRKAATYLTANKPATTVGTTLKKQTATYADVV